MNQPDIDNVQKQVQAVVNQIQAILDRIQGSRQPPSQLEIAELQALGEAYGRLTERLGKRSPAGET